MASRINNKKTSHITKIQAINHYPTPLEPGSSLPVVYSTEAPGVLGMA